MKLLKNKLKIKNLKIKTLLFLFFTFSVLSFMFVKVHAQEVIRTMTITPPTVAFTLDPGRKAEGQMKIINDSPNPITFDVNVQDFIVVDTIGTPNMLPPNTLNSKYSLASWIGATPQKFTVLPGQKQVIDYFIQIPKDAKPGGHYAAAIYTAESKGGQGTGAAVIAQIGTLFYITVKGPVTERATITNFFANSFQEYGPVKILTQIKNFGNLHIAPKGTINVTGLFFNNTKDLPTHNIFPETARNFENTVGQNLMIGSYKAVLLASYGVNNNLPLTATLYFWVFPWRLAIVVVLVIVAIILGWMVIGKKKQRRF